MYELKRLFKRHIEENLLKYILILSLFATGILLGFVFSKNVSISVSESLKQEIGVIIDGFSEGSFNKIEILKTSFLKNLRIFLLIFIGGFSVWILPVSFAAFLSYGFSLGFTIGYFSLNFGGKGLAITVVSVMFVFLVNVPVYITLGVVAFNNSKYRRHSRNGDGNLAAFTVIFGLMFIISLMSVAADAFVIPGIISIICS